MGREIKITKVEATTYEFDLENMGKDYNTFNLIYKRNGRLKQNGSVLTIYTDAGLVGEYPFVSGPGLAEISVIAQYLIGRNPLERELIYNDTKRGLRHYAMAGVGLVDICLWDIAGKLFDAPIYEMLGGKHVPLPAYASTLHGDENGGLGDPDQFVEFAAQCKEIGYPAFKVHGWGPARDNIQREIQTVLKLGEHFEGRMDLMIDPACEVKNFADALRLGKACDEAGFFWWEDPYQDGGISQFAHKKLKEMVKTPILQTEHIRGLEQHVDFVVAGSTDFVRAGAHEDGGVTGAMKIAHAAEGFGLDVELHGPGPVHRHIMSAIRNTNYYELGLVNPKVKTMRPPIYLDYNDDLDAVDSSGCVMAPEGPGIGVALDWDWIKAHQNNRVTLAEEK